MHDLIYIAALEAKSKLELENQLKQLKITDIDASKTESNGLMFTPASRLAYEKHYDKVEWLLDLGADLGEVVHSYAMRGCHRQIDRCLMRENANIADEKIAHGYAIGGHHKQVKQYHRQFEVSINEIAHGYAMGGHVKHLKKYCIKDNKADLDLIIKFYKEAKNNVQLEKYDLSAVLANYLYKRSLVKNPKTDRTQEYYVGFFTSFQKSYTQKQEAVLALQQALLGTPVDLEEHLSTLKDGQLGVKLNIFIKSGQANRYVDGQKVKSIRQFIEALQKKNNLEINPKV
jgi:hypothetical protein